MLFLSVGFRRDVELILINYEKIHFFAKKNHESRHISNI